MKTIIFLTITLLFMSCAADFYSALNRADYVPVTTKPVVKSFATENAMVICWEDDPGAHEYCLYKDVTPGSFSKLIYRGSDLSFTDTNVDDNTFYYYKLAKIKGETEFDKSSYTCGVTGSIKTDKYEDNDNKDCALPIELEDTYANIFYYTDLYGNTIVDRDWYYVEVDAGRTVNIQVFILDTNNSYIDDSLFFCIEGGVGEVEPIISGSEFPITNPTTTKKTYRFQIFVNDDKMQPNKTTNYYIHFVSII